MSEHENLLSLLQGSPGGSPHDSARSARASQRGSTTSPGQEALAKAADLLALLVCCHVKAELAPDGLVLINDLVQLLYYHGSNVAHRPQEEPADEGIHLLSPLVQVSGSLMACYCCSRAQLVMQLPNTCGCCHTLSCTYSTQQYPTLCAVTIPFHFAYAGLTLIHQQTCCCPIKIHGDLIASRKAWVLWWR